MKLLETRVYRGPSLYGYRPVIRLTVDLEELEQFPSTKIPGFVDRLLADLPTLDEHGCSYGHAGGFVKRLREGTWFGHITEHVAIELQCLAGTPVTYGKTRGAGREGVYHIIYSFEEERVGKRAGDLALRYLADPKIAVAEVAYLLGYSEPSPFHRAFKRWTGKTPAEA